MSLTKNPNDQVIQFIYLVEICYWSQNQVLFGQKIMKIQIFDQVLLSPEHIYLKKVVKT